MYFFRIIVLLKFYFLFLFPVNVLSQTEAGKSEVRNMFSPDTKDLWINFFSGTIAGIHAIDMIIGTDGTQCKGLYTVRNSGTKFYFEGEDIDDHLRLIEVNKAGNFSGYILGKYNGQSIDAFWMDSKKIQKLPIKASLVSQFADYQPTQCYISDWYQMFDGVVNDKRVKLSIYRNKDFYKCSLFQDGRVTQDILIENESVDGIISPEFPGTVLAKVNIKITNPSVDEGIERGLDVFLKDDSLQFVRTGFFVFDCYEYADFTTRLELERPKLSKPRFNQWLESNFRNWLSENEKKIRSEYNEDNSVSERWLHNIFGWVEVDYYSEDIISGTIFKQSSFEAGTKKKTFIYDLNGNKELKPDDLFIKEFDHTKYFKAVIQAKKKELQLDSKTKEWLEKQNFEFMTIKVNGLSFRSEFNTIFGEHEILIPYTELSGKIKTRALMKDLNLE